MSFDDGSITHREIMFPEYEERYRNHLCKFLDYYRDPVPIDVELIHEMAQSPVQGDSDDDHVVVNNNTFFFNLGYDIYAVPDEDWENPSSQFNAKFVLNPGCSKIFSTGIKIATPPNWGFLLRDRSGMGVHPVGHTAGVIEGTYRGEWKVNLVNLGHTPRVITMRKAIVQAVLTPIIPSKLNVVDKLDDTKRGRGGFGSSGR